MGLAPAHITAGFGTGHEHWRTCWWRCHQRRGIGVLSRTCETSIRQVHGPFDRTAALCEGSL